MFKLRSECITKFRVFGNRSNCICDFRFCSFYSQAYFCICLLLTVFLLATFFTVGLLGKVPFGQKKGGISPTHRLSSLPPILSPLPQTHLLTCWCKHIYQVSVVYTIDEMENTSHFNVDHVMCFFSKCKVIFLYLIFNFISHFNSVYIANHF